MIDYNFLSLAFGYWVFLDEIEIVDRGTHTTKTKTESIEKMQENRSPKRPLERERDRIAYRQ